MRFKTTKLLGPFVFFLLHLTFSSQACLAGYIQVASDGKSLIDSDTGKMFTPLGWKPFAAWKYWSEDDPRRQIGNQSYEEWVRDELAANGVNFINIWFTSYYNGIPFEPNKGEFNVAMDDGTGHVLYVRALPLNSTEDEKEERHLLLYGDPDDISDGSNITQLLEACEKYGVKVKVSLANNADYSHSWNINIHNSAREQQWWCEGTPSGYCVPGPVETKEQSLTDPESLEIMKERIRFIIENWGESPAIAVWELMIEINWSHNWASHEILENWTKECTAYIKQLDRHDRPTMLGGIDFEWRPWDSSTPPAIDEIEGINPIFDLQEVDIPSFHNYKYYNIWDRLIAHRVAQQRYPDKLIIFGGGSGPFRAACPDDGYCIGLPPEVNGPFIPDYAHQYYEDEFEGVVEPDDPWINSKAHVWLNLIASGGTGGATRFTSYVPYHTNGFSSIYYAPSKFVQEVDWDRWEVENMKAWEDWEDWGTWSNPHAISMTPWVEKRIAQENADFVAAQGDGDQLMIMVRGSQDNVTLAIPDLEPGTYTTKIFDWQTGDVVEERTIDVNSQPISYNLDLSDSNLTSSGECNNAANDYKCYNDPNNPYYSRRRMAIVYFEKDDLGSPTVEGDLNNDGAVDIFDLVIIGNCFGQEAVGDCARADANGNGVVDIFDLVLVGGNFGV
ncbi:hypothetical protein KKB83_05660 [Patescibacteria group bacterium]|nr:hypothetical protein [Patescibacteria group bacterium]